MFCSIHVCICDFNRDTWRCFQSLVFWGLFVFFICWCCFGFFFHLRPNWGLSLALQSPEKMDSKDLVVLWTSWHFSFIVLCHMPFFCMLANWHSLAIFKKTKQKQNKKTDHGEAYSSNNGTAWKLCICCLYCWKLVVARCCKLSVTCNRCLLTRNAEHGAFMWWCKIGYEYIYIK